MNERSYFQCSYHSLIENVLKMFRPGRFIMTFFANKVNDQSGTYIFDSLSTHLLAASSIVLICIDSLTHLKYVHFILFLYNNNYYYLKSNIQCT